MTRRPTDPKAAAEAMFKPKAPAGERMSEARSAVPHAKEMVSLRIDRDVIEAFQEEGPGWQERINAALRKAAGL